MNKKSILITGAASGIGRETAHFFAEKGWFTGLYDLDKKGLASLENEIGKDNCCFKVMDVTDIKSVQAGVKHFDSKTGGKMDVLFANAGVLRMGFNEEIPIEDQHLIVDVNLKGVLNSIHASLYLLKSTDNSRIINMSSGSALTGCAHLSVYSATKAAVSSLTESLNLELEQHGIFVSDLKVPYVNTPLLNRDVKAASIEKLGINFSPENVAKAVWKAAAGKKKIHNSRGMLPFYFLMKLPGFIRRAIMKFLLLPSKKTE